MQRLRRIYKRYLRTAILAIVATATFVWSAIDMFDVDPQEMWQFFQMSALGLVVIVGCAATIVTLYKIIRR